MAGADVAHGRLSRRLLLGVMACGLLGPVRPQRARAFGEDGAFNPRLLRTGTTRLGGVRTGAPRRWSLELVRRTSAPARVTPTTVRADVPELLDEPFAIWAGASAPEPLTRSELRGLKQFLLLGGVLLVDDSEPGTGKFMTEAKRQLARVLPSAAPVELGPENVVFRSYYLLRRAVGRVTGSGKLGGIVEHGNPRVLLSSYDLLGALARRPGGVHPLEVVPGGEAQREQAVRLAVNIAMFVLCSDYKDDQVHAPALMRRRAMEQP